MYIVTEFMINGSLREYLRTGEGKNIKLSQMIAIAAQVNGLTWREALTFQAIHESHKVSGRVVIAH